MSWENSKIFLGLLVALGLINFIQVSFYWMLSVCWAFCWVYFLCHFIVSLMPPPNSSEKYCCHPQPWGWRKWRPGRTCLRAGQEVRWMRVWIQSDLVLRPDWRPLFWKHCIFPLLASTLELSHNVPWSDFSVTMKGLDTAVSVLFFQTFRECLSWLLCP